MRILLFLIALVCTGLWIAGYVYLHALGCAYVSSPPPGACRIDMPWELRGEDLVILVLSPGAIVGALWALFIGAVRRARAP